MQWLRALGSKIVWLVAGLLAVLVAGSYLLRKRPAPVAPQKDLKKEAAAERKEADAVEVKKVPSEFDAVLDELKSKGLIE